MKGSNNLRLLLLLLLLLLLPPLPTASSRDKVSLFKWFSGAARPEFLCGSSGRMTSSRTKDRNGSSGRRVCRDLLTTTQLPASGNISKTNKSISIQIHLQSIRFQ